MEVEKKTEELLKSVACYIEAHYEEASVECCAVKEITCPMQAMTLGKMRTSATDECICGTASLKEMLEQADLGFSERLLQIIDERGCKDAEVYKKASISKQHFSKIRNHPDYRPTKPTAVAFALALGLDVVETNDLIGRAGFTLSNSSKFDLIIRYCIENRIYDIVQINMVLYEFDQPLLGS